MNGPHQTAAPPHQHHPRPLARRWLDAHPLDNSSCLILPRIGEGRHNDVEARREPDPELRLYHDAREVDVGSRGGHCCESVWMSNLIAHAAG